MADQGRFVRHGLTAGNHQADTFLHGVDDEGVSFYVSLTCGEMWRLLKGFTPVDRMLEKLGMPDQTVEPPDLDVH